MLHPRFQGQECPRIPGRFNRQYAVPFAKRWTARHVDAGVFSVTIPVCAVLAVFGDAREQELVVNPNMLRNRVVLDETLRARPRGVAHPLLTDVDCVRVER